MLGLLLQLALISYLVHLYSTELTPDIPHGRIVVFACMVTYGLTRLLRWTWRLIWR